MNSQGNILVCVTQQKTCERLILKAAELKDNPYAELFVIHVAKNSWNFLDNDKEGEALEYLFGISKSVGAKLTVLRSDNILETIVDFADDNSISRIVVGKSPSERNEHNFYSELKKFLVDIEILIV